MCHKNDIFEEIIMNKVANLAGRFTRKILGKKNNQRPHFLGEEKKKKKGCLGLHSDGTMLRAAGSDSIMFLITILCQRKENLFLIMIKEEIKRLRF